MRVKNHYLCSEEDVMQVYGKPVSLKGVLKKDDKLPIKLAYDSPPEKVIGYATNFRYRKGALICDMELEIRKPAQRLAVVPSVDITTAPKIRYLFVTSKPINEKAFVKEVDDELRTKRVRL